MIKPVQTFTDFVRKKQFQVKAQQVARRQLLSLSGGNIKYQHVLTAKDGSVAALGYQHLDSPYTHAYAILRNGDHIQTIAKRMQITNNTVKDTFTKLISRENGICDIKTSTIEKGINGQLKKVTSKTSRFKLG